VWMPSRYAKQGASAVAAERATAVLGRFVPRELIASDLDRNLSARNRKPRDECGAVVPAAHAAMAVTAKERRQRHDEANRATETAAPDPFMSNSAHASILRHLRSAGPARLCGHELRPCAQLGQAPFEEKVPRGAGDGVEPIV